VTTDQVALIHSREEHNAQEPCYTKVYHDMSSYE